MTFLQKIGEEAMMGYSIRFLKKLCDDSGHQHICVQGIVQVRKAKSLDRALEAAQRRFERMKKISRWDLYADTFQVEADFDNHH
jgi:hypothetical protein